MRRRLIALVAAMILVGAACSDNVDGADPSSPPSDSVVLPDRPAPADPGSYGVGRSTVMLVDEEREGRELTVDVWFPVDADVASSAEPSVYAFIPGVEFTTELARADLPVATDGPFPLVVFSHGSGGIRFQSTFLTEILASHGYVVIAPDHTGNTAYDVFLGSESSDEENGRNRPLDVSFVIDEVDAAVQPGLADLAAQVDLDRIGVVGHSAGGYTALAVAGGVPGAPADDRVDAIVGMAAAAGGVSSDTLGAIELPTLLLSGTRDETTPIVDHTEPAWDGVTGGPVVRVDITDAGHQSFADVCLFQDLIPTIEDPPAALVAALERFAVEGCAPELIDIVRAQEIINTFAVSFLDEFVGGDSSAEVYLTEAFAQTVPEIVFQRRSG